MLNKSLKKLVSIVAITTAFTLNLFNFNVKAENVNVKRLGGEDRYETSTLIAQEYIDKASADWDSWNPNKKTFYVNLADGENFRYPLTMTPTSYLTNGVCVLFNPKDSNLSLYTKSFIENAKEKGLYRSGTRFASDVNILNYESNKVYNELIPLVGSIGGSNVPHFEYDGEKSTVSQTLAHIAIAGNGDEPILDHNKYNVPSSNSNKYRRVTNTVFLVNADMFADAIAASTFSAMHRIPIIFTEKDYLGDNKPNVKDNLVQYFKQSNAGAGNPIQNVIILGGTGVISQAVEDQVESLGINVIRLAGEDRYETAMNVVKYFDVGDYTGLTITSGKNFPDSAVGAQLAAYTNCPIMPYDEGITSNEVTDYIKSKFTGGYILGGQGVTPDDSIKKLLK